MSRQTRSVMIFIGLLLFCSVMVIRQFTINQGRHVELREAFILLYTKGYEPQAHKLYRRLLVEMERLPDRVLLEDFQRTLTLIEPLKDEPENLIWRYHWTVSNEMEKRSEATLQRALKLADEE